jgi:osmotically-inducible protein OsmY
MSDKSLEDAVRAELDWDPKVDSAHIGVSAGSGAVTLAGYVHSYPQKFAAVHAAERVQGVSAVADGLEVKLPGSLRRNDTDIAEAIARKRESSTVIPSSVLAEVDDGNVVLRGDVEWAFQRDAAAAAIRHLAGVRNVRNLIVVKPRVRREAAETERRVEEALERTADIDARSVRVTAEDGAVHLSGRVRSLSQSRAAVKAAESAPGVMHVENDLVVRPRSSPPR